jgi:hypothetical protein
MNPPSPIAPFQPLWTPDLSAVGRAEPAWLWHGYLVVGGGITLLTSQWKTGKTTLASALLARLQRGGEFAGRALRAGKAVILTEESADFWVQRGKKLSFGDHLCWFCRPFVGRPDLARWQALLANILELHGRHHFDLVVIDTLLHFLPSNTENSATAMMDFLLTLRPLTDQGMAVWIQHHPRKGRTVDGQAARGTGALLACVDIFLEMTAVAGPGVSERRRRVIAFSRFDETPARPSSSSISRAPTMSTAATSCTTISGRIGSISKPSCAIMASA